MSICDWFKSPEKRTPPKVESYDYKVTERRDQKGVSYYVGSSRPGGKRYILAECPYTKRRYNDNWRTPRFERHVTVPKYVPTYVLVPMLVSYSLSNSSMITPVYAKFKDPVEVRDTICRIMREAKEAQDNKDYCKVVSQGECKCP